MMKIISLLTLAAFLTQPLYAGGRIQNEDVKSQSDITAAVLTTTGNVTSGNACIASPASTTGLATGLFIYDTTHATYVASGTTIVGLPGTCSAGQIQMSANAAGTATSDTLTFGGQPSQMINDTKLWSTAVTPPQSLSSAISSGLIGGGGGGSGKNYLLNSSFEGGYNSGWTTVTATGSNDTVNFTDGSQSAKLTMSATAGDIYQDVTPTTTLAGVNLQASCYVDTTLTGVKVCARSNGVDINCTNVPASGTWQNVVTNFQGPALGTSIGVDVISTSATGSFNVDQCYVGKSLNVSQVSQAQYIGQIKFTGGTTGNAPPTSPANFVISGTTVTTIGTVSAPSGGVLGVVLPVMSPGTYTFVLNGPFACYNVASVAAINCTYGLSTNGGSTLNVGYGEVIAQGAVAAGTTLQEYGAPITLSYPVSSTATNVTVSVAGYASSTDGTLNASPSNAEEGYATIDVYYVPSQSQTVITENTAGAFWSGHYDNGGNGYTGASGSVQSNWDYVSGSGSITTTRQSNNISCSADASNNAGILCNLPYVGQYLVCTSFGAGITPSYSLLNYIEDGSNNIITSSALVENNGGVFTDAVVMCGVENVTSISSPLALRATVSVQSGGTAQMSPGSSFTGQTMMDWNIVALTQQFPAPILANAVVNTGAPVQVMASANIAGGCSINYQSGSWLTLNSGASTTGYCVYNVTAGAFSGSPVCTTTFIDNGSSDVGAVYFQAMSNTSISVHQVFGGTPTNIPFTILCMGPK